MSSINHLRSRARFLQKKTGQTYQQCLNALQSLGNKPLELAQEFNWEDIKRADAFLVDPMLDDEFLQASNEGRYVREGNCDNCSTHYFIALDKKGMEVWGHPELCPACLSSDHLVQCLRCMKDMIGAEESFCEDCQGWFDSQLSPLLAALILGCLTRGRSGGTGSDCLWLGGAESILPGTLRLGRLTHAPVVALPRG